MSHFVHVRTTTVDNSIYINKSDIVMWLRQYRNTMEQNGNYEAQEALQKVITKLIEFNPNKVRQSI